MVARWDKNEILTLSCLNTLVVLMQEKENIFNQDNDQYWFSLKVIYFFFLSFWRQFLRVFFLWNIKWQNNSFFFVNQFTVCNMNNNRLICNIEKEIQLGFLQNFVILYFRISFNERHIRCIKSLLPFSQQRYYRKWYKNTDY